MLSLDVPSRNELHYQKSIELAATTAEKSNSCAPNMIKHIIPAQTILPLESVKLGRFITSVEQPQQSYHDPPSANEPSVLKTVLNDFNSDLITDRSSSIVSTLLSVISASLSRRTRSAVHMVTDCIKTYTLSNSDGWFDKAVTLPETREWVERALDRGKKVYMIVGFHTITNVKLSHQSNIGHKVEGQLQVPAVSALGAMGITVPFGDVLDPRICVQQQVVDGKRSQFSAPGEYICAIQYRQLRHNWLSSKEMDANQLSGVRYWYSVERSRDEEDGEDDIVQVDLIDLDDIERWEKHTSKDTDECFLLDPLCR